MPKANCGSCDSGAFQGRTAPVDSFYASDLGLYHMGGNVAECCRDMIKMDTGSTGLTATVLKKTDGLGWSGARHKVTMCQPPAVHAFRA